MAASGIKISIPTPCHENWDNMTPADRGRFCAACQKTVVDFTRATDREIVAAYNRDEKLCGRFLSTQLNRELVIPKEKNSLWARAAALTVLSMGGVETLAQTPEKTELREVKNEVLVGKSKSIITKTITGIITDSEGMPIPGCKVTIQSKEELTTVTDFDGNFNIQGEVGDILIVTFGEHNKEIEVTKEDDYPITLKNITWVQMSVAVWETTPKERTFFGRIFHAIGNIFR
ncbi:hypothetical protein AM493_02220 [Flavobacterium akiainvivens]|uniref:TonB-dependent receptor plug domain-containing protein n=1 Tax=Flavobacterium akiainvivens TaxID=1202724 RepID=A0A0M9VGY0_9FLAO|nr:hypothetical protein [Flavobacterium akiainvivens]KOS04986.1 hypothetical protein AM493_02220 [Flavobacterium akiainvivens]SFQ40944.1 Carboxypeptidase regulatory-like domain-containing protein [Flavobacterium akiainvivens]